MLKSLRDFPKTFSPTRGVVIVNKEGFKLDDFDGWMSPLGSSLMIRQASEVARFTGEALDAWEWAWVSDVRKAITAEPALSNASLVAEIIRAQKEAADLRTRLAKVHELSKP